MILTIFLTDPYIVVIAAIVTQLFCSWSEGEERERGRQVWGKITKHKEGRTVAEKHATLQDIDPRTVVHLTGYI